MDSLREFLNPLLPGTDYRLSSLAGDASIRNYYRISLNEQSWILMEWEPFLNPKDFPFLSIQSYFQKSGVRVPKIHHFSEKRGLFLMEDLGDLSLEKEFWNCKNQKDILALYKKVLDQLIVIHSLCFQKDSPGACVAYEQEFSVKKFLWELNFAKEHLLKGLFSISFSKKEEKALESEFQTLCEKLYKAPKVICHRDFHCRNVMITSNEVAIIDFQDARMGPVVYDLVSLFYDSYITLNPSLIKDLTDHYINHFAYFDQLQLTQEQWQEFLQDQILQRCFKACGSFASFKMINNNDAYLSYIPPTLNKILENLENHDSYPIWKKTLERSKSRWENL